MKSLLTVLLLCFFTVQSNAQDAKWTIKNGSIGWDSATVGKYLYTDTSNRKLFIRSFNRISYAVIHNNSDTLIITDTIWSLNNQIIRYIKIFNKVYSLK